MRSTRGWIPAPPATRHSVLIVLVALFVAACGSSGPITDIPTDEVTDAPQPTATASSGQPTDVPTTQPTESVPPTIAPTEEPATVEPGKPTGVTFDKIGEAKTDSGGTRKTYRITWKAPQGEATAFLVYGVKECLNASKATNHKPCVVRHMSIPRNTLALLAQAPGAARSTEISWTVPKSGKVPYAAVLIRATNAAGNSTFTIVHSENVCWRC
jgi:hypothetical protein